MCAQKGSITGSVKASSSGPSTEVVTEETSVEVSPEVDAMTLEELITYTDEMLKASSEEDENSGYNLRTYDDRIVVEMWYTGMNDLVKLAVEDGILLFKNITRSSRRRFTSAAPFFYFLIIGQELHGNDCRDLLYDRNTLIGILFGCFNLKKSYVIYHVEKRHSLVPIF